MTPEPATATQQQGTTPPPTPPTSPAPTPSTTAHHCPSTEHWTSPQHPKPPRSEKQKKHSSPTPARKTTNPGAAPKLKNRGAGQTQSGRHEPDQVPLPTPGNPYPAMATSLGGARQEARQICPELAGPELHR